MFTTLIVQPIFNLLVLIYTLIPGHNFGLAIVLFTIVVRLLMWPLVKKQLHHAKAMRELQPEIKKIKKAAAGNRQKESALTMELYKEKEINPFASLGIVLVQLPILLGLYIGLKRIIDNPDEIISFSYPVIHDLGWMKTLAADITKFDESFFGLVNLTRPAVGAQGVYWPALVIVVASAIAQYFQGRQLMPRDPEARSLRKILREAGKGKQAEQSEVNAAVTHSTQYLIPILVLVVAINLAVALPLYWLTSSLVAYIQQARVLKVDAAQADASVKTPVEGTEKKTRRNKKTKSSSKKRRKR